MGGLPNRAAALSELSVLLYNRYEGEGNSEDLNQAIKYCHDAIHLIPKGGPDKAECLSNLGVFLRMRYERDRKLDDLNQAIKYCRVAIHLTPKGARTRLDVAIT